MLNRKAAASEQDASEPPSIDRLLAASRWDDRLAAARARRERILAERPAQTEAKPKPWEAEAEAPHAEQAREEQASKAPQSYGWFSLQIDYWRERPFQLAVLSAFLGYFLALGTVQAMAQWISEAELNAAGSPPTAVADTGVETL